VPTGPNETRAVVRWAVAHRGPSYVRIPRFPVPEVTPADAEFNAGKSQMLLDGDDVHFRDRDHGVARALDAGRTRRTLRGKRSTPRPPPVPGRCSSRQCGHGR
jgi:transketolase